MNKETKQILLLNIIIVCMLTLSFTTIVFAQQQIWIQQQHHIQSQQNNNKIHIDYVALEYGMNEIKNSGKYYLNKDYTSSVIITGNNTEVTLCLNGHSIISSDKNAAVSVTNGATLILCDCKNNGKITGSKKVVYL
ncbi:MAG: hypothetical protein HFE58_01775 [Firmicutes bacterium]|nr:hypothetical protein [Bacillota bacterium]